MSYGEPIERVGRQDASPAVDPAADPLRAAQIAESVSAVQTAALRALSSGNGRGGRSTLSVADVSPKGVILKAESAKASTYFTIPAPNVDTQNYTACLDRVIAYMQVENDELMIKLASERLDQNQASLDARHKAQLARIDKQIAEMREEESAETLSKIFKWIGAGIAIAAAAIAATILTIVSCGAASPSIGAVIALSVTLVTSLLAATVMTLDAAGVFQDLQEKLTDDYMREGMSRAEAQKAASKIIMGITLGAAILNMLVQIGASVFTGGAGAAQAVTQFAQTVMQIAKAAEITTSVLQGVQAVGSGIADVYKANAEYNQAVAEADVKKSEASLKEAQDFVSQNMTELEALVDAMQEHLRAFRAIVASKGESWLQTAMNI